MESILRNYLNHQSSDSDEDNNKHKNLLSDSESDNLYNNESNQENQQDEEQDIEQLEEKSDLLDSRKEQQSQKLKLPSFMQAMNAQAQQKEKPKFLQRKDLNQLTEFDILHSYKNKQAQEQKKEEKAMIVEGVIEKKGEVAQGNVNEIEKVIQERSRQEPIFKKSRIGKTKFQVRDEKRQKRQGREERTEKKRHQKFEDKSETKNKKQFQGQK